MSGRDGVYSPETGQLEGAVTIGVTWPNGESFCTGFHHVRITPSEGTAFLEDEAFRSPTTLTGTPTALPMGRTGWAGQFSCGGITFDLTLDLHHDEGGCLAGIFGFRSIGKVGFDGEFLLTGTHNPDTGRLTLGPRGWTTGTPPRGGQRMYYVDGHHLRSPQRLRVRIITDSGPCLGDKVFTLKPSDIH